MSAPASPLLVVLTPADWRLWRELRARTLASAPDAFGSTLEQESRYGEDEWRARLARGRAVVAVVDGEPVAIGGCLEEEPGVHTVVSMWVDPAWRGRGLGRLVLDDLLAAARAHGGRVRLWVTDGNPARRLYESAGFADTGASGPLRPGSSLTRREMELRR